MNRPPSPTRRCLLLLATGLATVAAGLSTLPLAAQQALPEELLLSVVRIENRERDGLRDGRAVIGTGFFVTASTADGPRTYLVTNKHVTSRDGTHLGERVEHLYLHLNRRSVRGTFHKLPPRELRLVDGENVFFRDHPDPEVDIVAVDVTDLFAGDTSGAVISALDAQRLAGAAGLTEAGIDLGAEVLALGFPLNITTVPSNLPVARRGIIASKLGEAVAAELPPGSGRIVELRAFLVDMTVLPNSSGSPVFARSDHWGWIVVGVLQGFFSESVDLGRAHGAENVLETLARF